MHRIVNVHIRKNCECHVYNRSLYLLANYIAWLISHVSKSAANTDTSLYSFTLSNIVDGDTYIRKSIADFETCPIIQHMYIYIYIYNKCKYRNVLEKVRIHI